MAMADPAEDIRAAALAKLEAIRDPRSGQGLVSAGLVQGLVTRAGRAGFMMEVPAADAALYGPVREAAEAALRTLPDVETAQVALTASAQPAAPAPRPRPSQTPKTRPAHVRHVIAVASGKGGVGKST